MEYLFIPAPFPDRKIFIFLESFGTMEIVFIGREKCITVLDYLWDLGEVDFFTFG